MTEDKDHPRGCGENTAYKSSSSYHLGSPPRMRGKRRDGTLLPASTGITPADAGKTHFIRFSSPLMRDHPRRCGENTLLFSVQCSIMGSPPQVRGKLRARCRLHDINRITPAGAGKTLKQKRQYAVNEDHPRRCGENISDPACCSSIKGSPPQVRGKPERNISGRSGFGITPAGAGKTLSLFFPPQLRQDHPRRCGENA